MSSAARMRASVEFSRRESPNLERRATSVPVLGVTRPSRDEISSNPGGDGMTTSSEALHAPKAMRLRYAGQCRVCACELPTGSLAKYNRETRSVTCVDCAPEPSTASPEIDTPSRPSARPNRPMPPTSRVLQTRKSLPASQERQLAARMRDESRLERHESERTTHSLVV